MSLVSFNLVNSLFFVILTQVVICKFLFDLKFNFKTSVKESENKEPVGILWEHYVIIV